MVCSQIIVSATSDVNLKNVEASKSIKILSWFLKQCYGMIA
jgi:hypothetical protein